MTRKDTILIAVLINAGLLIIMFATAIKPNHLNDQHKENPVSQHSVSEKNNISTKNEIDHILSSYTAVEEKKDKEAETLLKKENAKEGSFAQQKKPEANTEQNTAKSALVKNPADILPQSKYTSVIIKAGDALEKIAKVHNTSVKEIMEVNHLENTKLQIGQVLYIPVAASIMQTSQEKPKESVKEKFYIVRNGDNPWTIASKNRIKIEELLKLNDLDEEKARRLKPGDRLRIQ
ncbi:MAG: LysM peptidoglycan-binding domain-containing protein [Simkaniaceae bacterium]